ncbi:hypothetical protein [Haloarcula amylolytica]|uniref:Uncharacterized protein n=1 Tax=Haloarcula amylolytica JCM 13557 TaxID=1227452 RepID=M0K774_9EURY|nr:hypothetical protein [Haloarcula amylolytica]EMA17036.1 hypothetical protein C442_17240 [Haloarcula amylolytica JCM 13557]
MSDIETTRWEHVVWICPHCGDEDFPSRLQLVDSRDVSIESREVWEGEYDAELHRRKYATETAVYCTDCKTVFDVSFTPRSREEDE